MIDSNQKFTSFNTSKQSQVYLLHILLDCGLFYKNDYEILKTHAHEPFGACALKETLISGNTMAYMNYLGRILILMTILNTCSATNESIFNVLAANGMKIVSKRWFFKRNFILNLRKRSKAHKIWTYLCIVIFRLCTAFIFWNGLLDPFLHVFKLWLLCISIFSFLSKIKYFKMLLFMFQKFVLKYKSIYFA